MDSMIKVEDVSMKFNLGIEKNFSLKLFFINMFKPKKKDEKKGNKDFWALKHVNFEVCLLYTSPSPRDTERSRMPSSA